MGGGPDDNPVAGTCPPEAGYRYKWEGLYEMPNGERYTAAGEGMGELMAIPLNYGPENRDILIRGLVTDIERVIPPDEVAPIAG